MLNACLCFGIAVSQNYILNTLITFAHRLSWRAYGLYIGANLFGLGVNLVVLWLCKQFLLPVVESSLSMLSRDITMLAFQAFAILCAMVSNFCWAKYVIFGERSRAATDMAPGLTENHSSSYHAIKTPAAQNPNTKDL